MTFNDQFLMMFVVQNLASSRHANAKRFGELGVCFTSSIALADQVVSVGSGEPLEIFRLLVKEPEQGHLSKATAFQQGIRLRH